MMAWFRKTWGQARSSVLREEFVESLSLVDQFDGEQSSEFCQTIAAVLNRLAQVGPIESLDDRAKKEISTMLSETARGLYASKPVRAYGTALVSMWIESQTLTGDDAAYVRLHASEFITATLRDHEPQRSLSDFSDKGRLLPSAARTYAVSSFIPFLGKFPSLSTVETRLWDATLTTAAIFVAVSRLNQEAMDEQTRNALLDIATHEAVRLDPQAVDAVDDCRAFVDRTHDGLTRDAKDADRQFLFSDSLGGWIVWNLVGHAPASEEECRMIRVLGLHVVQAFHSWWAQPDSTPQ